MWRVGAVLGDRHYLSPQLGVTSVLITASNGASAVCSVTRPRMCTYPNCDDTLVAFTGSSILYLLQLYRFRVFTYLQQSSLVMNHG